MKRQHAFTLVELAIVLVIIGLIVGGVLVGRDLIRGAELQSVITDEQKFVAAVNTFLGKYKGLPGDMMNGTDYWGSAGGTGNDAACVAAASTTATCNGNGDGKLTYNTTQNEPFRAWQQLASAGLIGGNFNGVANVNPYGVAPTNSPVGRINNSLWYNYNFATQSSGANHLFDAYYDNSLSLGGSNVSSNNWPYAPIFFPGEMSNIDGKIDDGMPATGKVMAILSFNNTCTDAIDNTTVTAKYLSTGTSLACAIIFRRVY